MRGEFQLLDFRYRGAFVENTSKGQGNRILKNPGCGIGNEMSYCMLQRKNLKGLTKKNYSLDI